MLDVVAEALAENGLKFERIEGRRSYGTALTRFRTLPEVRVLLLPIKTGAQVSGRAAHVRMLVLLRLTAFVSHVVCCIRACP